MTRQQPTLLASALLALMVAAPATSAGPGATKGPGGNRPLVIPAGAFASDGDHAAAYWIPGEYISGGAGVTSSAGISPITGSAADPATEGTSRAGCGVSTAEAVA